MAEIEQSTQDVNQEGRIGGRQIGRFLLALVPLALITGYVLITRPDLEDLANYGYLGVAAIMFVSNATVLLPMPGLATVTAAGALWNPLLVGLAAGIGGAGGELIGYLAGFGAHDMLDARRSRFFERVKDEVGKHGFFAILVLAAVPNPFFDVVGLAAGSVAYSPWRFYVAVALGNVIKCSLVALVGSTALTWISGG
ncbi:MAG: VTT domain-containing protein [Chloroflexota bacterium]